MIDLHVHTTMSDGEHPPARVVRMAAELGVRILAVTDHDTVDGLEEAAQASRAAGIAFIPGIELAASGYRELHILGYYIDPQNTELRELCAEQIRQRGLREARILAFLADRGVDLTIEQVRRHVTNGLAGRPHFARAMVEAGYVSTTQEAFERHLGVPEFGDIDRPKPTPEACIRAITEAGGVAALAHPSLLRLDDDALETLLRRLIIAGLRGIECVYSLHTPAQTAFYRSLAEKYGIVVTGGSDFHGESVKPGIRIATGINGTLCFDDCDISRKLLRHRLPIDR